MKLEATSNIKAQNSNTVSKSNILKFTNEVYTTIQAIKYYNMLLEPGFNTVSTKNIEAVL